MLHKPAGSSDPDPALEYKKRIGAWMFLLYALVYAGFVAINVINPLAMGTIVMFGLNLAVVYGFGLIFFALILALIYNRMCSAKEKELRSKQTPDKE